MRAKTKRARRKKPKFKSAAEWFAELDRLNTEPFMGDGRNQPKMPRRKVSFTRKRRAKMPG